MIFLVLIVNCYLLRKLWVMDKNIQQLNRESKGRHEALNKWLFDSLYSINHNVKLPEDKKIVETKRPAKVYNYFDDPMREFDVDETLDD